jgi:hypothetical protein
LKRARLRKHRRAELRWVPDEDLERLEVLAEQAQQRELTGSEVAELERIAGEAESRRLRGEVPYS